MDKTWSIDGVEASESGIFHLPGEPAIVINGLPPISTGDADVSSACNVPVDTKPQGGSGFGEWLVGREVVKSFGGELYTGRIREYDEEMGWYRVVYEDGDSEDVEWSELEEVLCPLDINVPLKSIAAKIIRTRQKSAEKPSKLGTGRISKHGA